jgi:hypothetical protein
MAVAGLHCAAKASYTYRHETLARAARMRRSPAQVYALVIGLTLVGAGILGFFYNASFGTGDGTERDAVLGILDVNGWHNLVHIATGLISLAFANSANARAYALAFGVVYLVVALLGFIAGDGDEIFNLIPVNTEDNVLHLLIGLAGVGAGLATPALPRPSTAPAA